ncbi:uncharacterized protein Dmul_12150 [Desulfococcus multivorans]|jgi:hypothetical protein|nr:uncharacterized protein Dmul_12150 [Desulfococcus multivorans]
MSLLFKTNNGLMRYLEEFPAKKPLYKRPTSIEDRRNEDGVSFRKVCALKPPQGCCTLADRYDG